MVHVELIYIAQDKSSVHLNMVLPQGALVNDALKESGIYETHPETKELCIGMYAKIVSEDTVLRDGDRIELYRPLTIDPKEKRRQLARARK